MSCCWPESPFPCGSMGFNFSCEPQRKILSVAFCFLFFSKRLIRDTYLICCANKSESATCDRCRLLHRRTEWSACRRARSATGFTPPRFTTEFCNSLIKFSIIVKKLLDVKHEPSDSQVSIHVCFSMTALNVPGGQLVQRTKPVLDHRPAGQNVRRDDTDVEPTGLV